MTRRLTIQEVMVRLGVSRATVYRNPYLCRTAIRAGKRTLWDEADVERVAVAQKQGIRKRPKRRAAA